MKGEDTHTQFRPVVVFTYRINYFFVRKAKKKKFITIKPKVKKYIYIHLARFQCSRIPCCQLHRARNRISPRFFGRIQLSLHEKMDSKLHRSRFLRSSPRSQRRRGKYCRKSRDSLLHVLFAQFFELSLQHRIRSDR